jgi:hypothetical protein
LTPSWLLDLLAAIMLAISAASAARILARPLLAGRPWRLVRTGTDVDLANAAMGVAMAGMFVPGLTTLPRAAWELLFGLLTAWFGYRAWADARSIRRMAAERCTLHVVHCAAMLYMFLALGAAASSGGGMGGPTTPPTLEYPTLAAVLVLLLISYAIWDLDQLSGKRYSLGSGGASVRAFLLAPQIRAGWDVVLGVAMAFMLVSTI